MCTNKVRAAYKEAFWRKQDQVKVICSWVECCFAYREMKRRWDDVWCWDAMCVLSLSLSFHVFVKWMGKLLYRAAAGVFVRIVCDNWEAALKRIVESEWESERDSALCAKWGLNRWVNNQNELRERETQLSLFHTTCKWFVVVRTEATTRIYIYPLHTMCLAVKYLKSRTTNLGRPRGEKGEK